MSDNLTYRESRSKLRARNTKSQRVVTLSLFLPAFFAASNSLSNKVGKLTKKSKSEFGQKTPLLTSISLMTFNVQNLFDSKHDAGKSDWAFLPKSQKRGFEFLQSCSKVKVKKWRKECFEQNWTPTAVLAKIAALAQAIQKAGHLDFILLQEVENASILKRLQKAVGFEHAYLLEGPDERGVDVAVLSRFEARSPPRLHSISVSGNRGRPKELRSLLELRFRVGGLDWAIFVLHLPSAGHPPSYRAIALKKLNELAGQIPPSTRIVAGGDFNIHPAEELKWRLGSTFLKPHWIDSSDVKAQGPAGTYFDRHQRKWSKLDRILLRKGGAPSSELEFKELRVLNPEPQDSEPRAFDPETRLGTSDHFALRAVIQIGPRARDF
jgi:endonuclease/exonuclease/phosphatase family metal-dependent hydrolase